MANDNDEARILAGILTTNRHITELKAKWERKKLAATSAKEDYESAVNDLQCKLNKLGEEYPLFPSSPGEADVAVAPEDGDADDEWTVHADRPALDGPERTGLDLVTSRPGAGDGKPRRGQPPKFSV